MLAEQIRKGRSLHIGYVISVQSAGDVPESIRNNLNTTIIGRHRNMSILRKPCRQARPEMLEQADKLNPVKCSSICLEPGHCYSSRWTIPAPN